MARLRQKERGGKWFLDYRDIDGARYRIDTGTHDKKVAVLWLKKAEELTSQAWLGIIERVGRINADVIAGIQKQTSSPTLKEFKEKYEDRCRHDLELSEGTISLNNLAFKSFIRLVGDKKLADLKDEDVIKWKRCFALEGKAKDTLAIYHRQLRAAFNRAIKYGFIKENPFEKVEVAKAKGDESKETKDLGYEEVQALLKVIDESNDPQFANYVRFLLYTGCRRNEVLYLCWDNIDFENWTLTVYSQKVKKRMTLPVNKALKRVIERMERKEGFVFQTDSTSHGAREKKQPWHQAYATHHFKKYIRKAGLPEHYSLHSLRHTYATYLRQQGVPLDIVQRLLGHSSSRITEAHYDHTVALHFRAQADLVDFEDDKAD